MYFNSYQLLKGAADKGSFTRDRRGLKQDAGIRQLDKKERETLRNEIKTKTGIELPDKAFTKASKVFLRPEAALHVLKAMKTSTLVDQRSRNRNEYFYKKKAYQSEHNDLEFLKRVRSEAIKDQNKGPKGETTHEGFFMKKKEVSPLSKKGLSSKNIIKTDAEPELDSDPKDKTQNRSMSLAEEDAKVARSSTPWGKDKKPEHVDMSLLSKGAQRAIEFRRQDIKQELMRDLLKDHAPYESHSGRIQPSLTNVNSETNQKISPSLYADKTRSNLIHINKKQDNKWINQISNINTNNTTDQIYNNNNNNVTANQSLASVLFNRFANNSQSLAQVNTQTTDNNQTNLKTQPNQSLSNSKVTFPPNTQISNTQNSDNNASPGKLMKPQDNVKQKNDVLNKIAQLRSKMNNQNHYLSNNNLNQNSRFFQRQNVVEPRVEPKYVNYNQNHLVGKTDIYHKFNDNYIESSMGVGPHIIEFSDEEWNKLQKKTDSANRTYI